MSWETLATHYSNLSSINPLYRTLKQIAIVGSLKTYGAMGQFCMKGPSRQIKGTKDQDKQQGRCCLLAKSATAKSEAETLLCQITGWKLELLPRARMFNSQTLYSIRDLDDATLRDTRGLCPHF